MDKLPIRSYVYPAYGVASLGKVAVEVMLQLYLFDFYTRVLGLDPIFAGLAFGLAIFWDALSDLLVSVSLFAARSRGVAYTTILWLGSILLAVASIFLFAPTEYSSNGYLFFHLLIAYVLVNTGMTLLDLPQSSLSAELSNRVVERNKLLASRMIFGIAGLALGSALPGIYTATQEVDSLRDSMLFSALVLACVVFLSGSLTRFFLRKRERETSRQMRPKLPNRADFVSLFCNYGFFQLLIAGVVAAIGRTINAALAFMYYRFVLDFSDAQVTQAIFPIFSLSTALSIPLWISLCKRYGKRIPASFAVSGLGFMGIIAYPSLPAGLLVPSLLVSSLGGILCGSAFLVDSIITDFIDRDEVTTGERKESLYFAIWKSSIKVARALAFVLIGLSLKWMGLDISLDVVSSSLQWGIISLFGFLVGICFMLAGFLIYRADVPEPIE